MRLLKVPSGDDLRKSWFCFILFFFLRKFRVFGLTFASREGTGWRAERFLGYDHRLAEDIGPSVEPDHAFSCMRYTQNPGTCEAESLSVFYQDDLVAKYKIGLFTFIILGKFERYPSVPFLCSIF